MRLQLLVTDNGKHSDEKLGFACAADIIQISADAAGKNAQDGRRLENQIADLVAKHMRAVANREMSGITAKGHDHLFQSLDAHPETSAALEREIISAGKASPLASWFDRQDTLANIRDAVDRWVRVSQHMHRDWFARHGMVGHGTELTKHPDYDPDHEHVKRWKDLHDAPTPDAFRNALHELQSGEKLS